MSAPPFDSDAAAAPAQSAIPRWAWLIVAGLLAVYAAMSWSAARVKGLSFDEGLQLAVGYNIWLNDDFRIEGANGDLVKRWATLPYLITRPKFMEHDDPIWKKGSGYDFGSRFFFELGNHPESLLRQGRLMIALFGVLTGFLVFWCSREIFGWIGGLVSLAAFAFSPSMLAFGAIVSTDLSITLTLFAATWCVWRLIHVISPGRVMVSLVVTGLMVLAKPTALVIFPITAVVVAVRLIAGRPLTFRWRGTTRLSSDRRVQAGWISVLAALHLVAGWVAIWAHYDFRYAASPLPADPSLEFHQPQTRDDVPKYLVKMMAGIERTRLLPEGFWRGIDALLHCDDGLGSFAGGHWSIGGIPWFFPYAIWVKTHPALFFLLGLGGVFGFIGRGRSRGAEAERMPPAEYTPYALTPFLALVGCYLAVAMTEDINIGHRHVLPIYPALHVLAGGVAVAWVTRPFLFRSAIVSLLAWAAVDSASISPHFLSYFAPQAGGPVGGYKRLVDSSLDWGMELPELRRWIDRHNPGGAQPLFLAYFGADKPRYYGIQAKRLPGFFERRDFEPYALSPGYYAISASLLQGVYTAAFGPWSKEYEDLYQATIQEITRFHRTESDPVARAELLKQKSPSDWMTEYELFDNLRFARLCAWLRHQGHPPYQVGYSILIWKLDRPALEAALLGPPAELVKEPPKLRRFRQFVAKGL